MNVSLERIGSYRTGVFDDGATGGELWKVAADGAVTHKREHLPNLSDADFGDVVLQVETDYTVEVGIDVVSHNVVEYEPGKFSAWPANNGAQAWHWGTEILVGFIDAVYEEKDGHNQAPPFHSMLARSTDGGETWTSTEFNVSGPGPAPGSIDFAHPDFALRIRDEAYNISYDRGHTWAGPYSFGGLLNDSPVAGDEFTSRTDYIVNSSNEVYFFMSSKREFLFTEDYVYTAKTDDGGASFDFVSFMDPFDIDRNVMPSTVRLSDTILVSCTRREDEDSHWIECYRSNDNGASWSSLGKVDSTGEQNGNPPALVRLANGDLVCVYGVREPQGTSRISAKVSADNGETWSPESRLRTDFAGPDAFGDVDLGYPRAFVRPDGKVVTVYYWATEVRPEQHIAATIFQVGPDNKLVEGTDQDDILTGGSGDDTVLGFAGNDTLEGLAGNDSLRGGNGSDTLEGGDGNDWLAGGNGNDSVGGGAGNDLLMAGQGNDLYDGGGGDDTLSFAGGFDGVSVDLGAGTASGPETGTDTVIVIEHVIGGDAGDALTGNGGDNNLDGGAGADTLHGAAGNDTLVAGDGEDALYGGESDDTLIGGGGDDILYGDEGPDCVRVRFISEDAGYQSTYGWYNTETGDARILVANVDTVTNPSIENFVAELPLTTEQLTQLGYFLIPDGFRQNDDAGEPFADGADPTALDLEVFQDGSVWKLRDTDSGYVFEGVGSPAYFTETDKNPDGLRHVDDGDRDLVADGAVTYAWEDLPNLGDGDFGDAVFQVETAYALEVSFVSETAGYRNSYGTYDTETGQAHLLVANVDTDTNPGLKDFSASLCLTPDELDQLGFFLIPDGFHQNDDAGEPFAEGTDPTALDLEVFQDGGVWKIRDTDSGYVFDGSGSRAYFTETDKNPGGLDHVNDEDGDLLADGSVTQGWEDLPDLGDKDFGDAVFKLSLSAGSGDDLVIGGEGNDTLTGGPGADSFHFEGANFGEDIITDFSLGDDKFVFDGLGTAVTLDGLSYEVDDFGGGTAEDIRITFAGLGDDLLDEQIDVLDVGSDPQALKEDILFV